MDKLLKRDGKDALKGFDGVFFLYAGDLVDWQMVHEHGIATLERWHEALFHIGEEHRTIHGSVDHHRSGQSIRT